MFKFTMFNFSGTLPRELKCIHNPTEHGVSAKIMYHHESSGAAERFSWP
jgi:hypothetical protein